MVCDEPISSLDVSIAAQVLNLLADLRERSGLSYLFISHNLGVVRVVSEEVLVLRAGRVVEQGPTAAVLQHPREDYTRRLRRSALEPALMSGRKPRDVVRHIADSVAEMYLGRIVEIAPRHALFARPAHPYTRALFASTPRLDARRNPSREVRGELPSPIAPPPGCAFHTRCPHAIDRCRAEVPELRVFGEARVACHRAEELAN